MKERGRESGNKAEEKVNLISLFKLDSPAFSNSRFRATATMWDVERGERERGGEGKGKANPCRGEKRETAAALPQADSNQ